MIGLDQTSQQIEPSIGLQREQPPRPSSDGRLLGHFPYAESDRGDLVPFEPGILLHVDAAEALDAMRQAAAADGVDLRLLSGFRSMDLQDSIFFDVASELSLIHI